MSQPGRARRRRRGRRGAALAAVVVIAVGGAAGAAYGLTRSSGPDYRLATVGRGDVTQTVVSNGTVSTAGQVEAGFSVSGTVSAVTVAVGQQVVQGEVLATLDTTGLERTVAQQTLTLAQAELRLALAENPPTTTSGGASAPKGGAGGSVGGGSSRGGAGGNAQGGAGLGAGGQGAAGDRQGAGESGRQGTGGQGSGSSSSGSTESSTAETAKLMALVSKVQDAEKALQAAQQAANLTLQDVEKKITAEQRACGPLLPGSSPTGPTTGPTAGPTTEPSGSATTSNEGTDAPSASPTGSDPSDRPSSGSLSATGRTDSTPSPSTGDGVLVDSQCLAAMTAVFTAQSDVSGAQAAVQTAAATLSSAISELQAALPTSAGGGSGPTGGNGGKPGGKPEASSPSTSPTGVPGGERSAHPASVTGSAFAIAPAVADLAEGGSLAVAVADTSTAGGPSGSSTADVTSDKAAVAAAQAQLGVAQSQLADATLTSPISGAVAVVGLTVGSSSSGQTITIIGVGGHDVSTTVALANVDLVKVGQPASVSIDGVSTPVSGRVGSIGVVNASSGSSAAYDVVITLDGGGTGLHDGTGAQVTVTVGTAKDVVVVPMSAVTTVGSIDTVTVMQAGTPATKRITVGVVGTASIEVKSGLSVGEQVVLADLSRGLPSSSTETSSRNGFPAGGPGGRAGFGGSGFGGSGFGGR